MRVYIGIDNGVSGSIGCIRIGKNFRAVGFIKTPTFSSLDYTKTVRNITRVDRYKLNKYLMNRLRECSVESAQVMIERPMINPGRFRATVSACRAMEATLSVLEDIGLSYIWIDSKEWQTNLLPHKVKGPALKKASLDIGVRMFPFLREKLEKHKDADGLLIAEYCRKVNSK